MRVWIVLFALLAGCASEATPDGSLTTAPAAPGPIEGATDGPESSPSNATLEPVMRVESCEQMHAIFPVPDTDWGLPDGWTASDGGASGFGTAVFVYPELCNDWEAMWVFLGVTPPDEYKDPSIDIEYWLLTGIGSDEGLVENLSSYGFPMRHGSVEANVQPGGDFWTAREGPGTYTLTGTYGNPAAEPFGPFVHRIWTLGNDDQPLGLRVLADAAIDMGTGSSVFGAQGDDAAPPLQGGIGHRVGEFSYTLVWTNTHWTGRAPGNPLAPRATTPGEQVLQAPVVHLPRLGKTTPLGRRFVTPENPARAPRLTGSCAAIPARSCGRRPPG